MVHQLTPRLIDRNIIPAIVLQVQRASPFFAARYQTSQQYQYQEAMRRLDEAVRLEPSLALSYNYRGQLYGAIGQPERAVVDFDEAIRLDPLFADAYYNRGLAYAELGLQERARADLNQAGSLDSKSAEEKNDGGRIRGSSPDGR